MADLHAQATRALDALRKADAGRTPGEWRSMMYDGAWGVGTPGDAACDLDAVTREDAAFIATVANAWPAVLDLIEATIADPTRTGAADCGPGVCYRLALAVLGVTDEEGE